MTDTIETGYAPVDGLRIYYEIQGSGPPLLLLHGGFGSTGTFAPLLPALARSRRVIALDLQGHGRTGDRDSPLYYEQFADDIAGVLNHLDLDRADLLGYSLGGGAALQAAILHPSRVRRLVVVSTPFRRTGWYPDILAAMAAMGPASAEAMKATPLYESYKALAPKPDDWPMLHNKFQDLLVTEYDWSTGVAGIQCPTMIVAGDADSFPVSHAAECFALLGGSQRDGGWDGAGRSVHRLAILPGETHYDILSSPLFLPTVGPFLELS